MIVFIIAAFLIAATAGLIVSGIVEAIAVAVGLMVLSEYVREWMDLPLTWPYVIGSFVAIWGSVGWLYCFLITRERQPLLGIVIAVRLSVWAGLFAFAAFHIVLGVEPLSGPWKFAAAVAGAIAGGFVAWGTHPGRRASWVRELLDEH